MKFYKENNRLPEPDEDTYVYDTRFFAQKQTKKDIAPLQEVLDRLIATGTIIPSKTMREKVLEYEERAGFSSLSALVKQNSTNLE